MIDIIIIVAYVLVAIKILLKLFEWIQNRYNIYGKPQTTTQPASSTDSEETIATSQKQVPFAQKQQRQVPLVAQPLTNQTELISESIPKTTIVQTEQKKFEKPTVPSPSQIEKVTQFFKQADIDIERYLIKPEQEALKLLTTDSVDPSQTKDTSSQVAGEKSLQSSQTRQNSSLNADVLPLRQQIDNLRRQKETIVQKMLKYAEQVEKAKEITEEKYRISMESVLREKQSLQNKINELQANHEQHIKEVQSKIGQKIQTYQHLLQEKQQVYQAQIRNLQSNLESKNIKSQNKIAETVNETITATDKSGDVTITPEDPGIQQLKSELEFCQSQLQQAYESQSKLKEEIEQLKSSSASRMKSRPQISITDVINHAEYLRIKEKLQKYETGTSTSHVRSVIRTEFTPQGERLSKGLDSRISERRSFISSKMNNELSTDKPQNSDEVFSECQFLTPETKHYLLDEIKKIKKLPIKKTKLIFKLDKLAPVNPHEFIDNIPNIVLLIELTNKKILAAFTQTAFSKQDSLHAEKPTTIARSRLGSNKSLIIDLTNKISFLNHNPNETIIYDENAIVWGKDELLIKNDQPTLLYSSFGSQEGVYWDGKYTLEELLGGNQGFERINHYEFYRIYIG